METHFEICGQVSRRLVPTGGEIDPQLLNGVHGSSDKKKRQTVFKDIKQINKSK